MQVHNRALFLPLMRIKVAAGAALRAFPAGLYFLIGRSTALAKPRIWARRLTAYRASCECRIDGRNALAQSGHTC